MRLATFLVLLSACGSSNNAAPPDDAAPDAPPSGPEGCPRTEAAADRARFAVVAHPYDADGMPATTYEVLDLSMTGELSRPNRTFEMGRGVVGTIAFTPDGEVGIVAQDDGTLGVFRLDAAGVPAVVHANFGGDFYADRVVVEPRGDRILVSDGNTRENGGGLYLMTIGCDGALTNHGLVVPARTPGGAIVVGPRVLLASGDALDSPAGDSVHLIDWTSPTTPTLAAGTDAFGDNLAIIGGSALTHDGTIFLVGDVSQFSGVPTRIAVVNVDAGLHPALSSRDTIDIEDPEAIAASPFGAVAVVASAFGDALFIVDDQGPNQTWRVRGEVAYTGAAPQLPGDLATIDRGMLRGHVLVSENVSVRHLAFNADGTVTDLGSLAFGSGLENIGGAIGVTP